MPKRVAKRPVSPRAKFSNAAAEADYFRQKVKPGRQLNTEVDSSITPTRVTQSVRMRFNPIRGLDPEKLVSYLEQWRLGFFRQAGMLWDQMERRDYQLQAVAPKRKKAVARHGYDILVVDEVPEGMEQLATDQQAFLKHFYNHISVTNAIEPDEKGGFSLLVRHMMDAIGKRYAVHEIVWQPGKDGSLTAQFLFCPIWWFEGTRGKLRFLQSEFQVYGNEMPDGEWLVTVHDGIMEACSLVFLLKHLPLKSWVALLDKFGQPGIHGKTDAPHGSKEWNDFVEAVQDFAQEWAAVTNRSGEITLVEAKASGGGENMFSTIVEKMDKAITTLWRGADLGTSSKTDSVGASLQGDETGILEVDDARIADETLMSQVSRHALAWKFGPDVPQLAYLKIRVPEEKNTEIDIKVDQFLTSVGGGLDLKEAYERYGRQIPKDGEATLKAPGAPGVADPNADDPEEAQVANEKPAPGVSSKFMAGATQDLSAALAPDLNAINQRFAALLKITDPALFLQRAAALKKWLDENEAHFLNNPELADAFHKIQLSAFANGLAAKK